MSTTSVTVRRTVTTWVVLGVAVAATPYLARPLGLVVRVPWLIEVVDHVLPGVVVVLLAVLARWIGRVRLEITLVAVLAGLWAFSTHVPLVLAAGRGNPDWGTALWHTTPAAALLGATSLSAVRAWMAA